MIGKEITEYIPRIITIGIQDKKHAECGDVVTPNNEFIPMLVLNTYLEPRFLKMYEKGQISRDYLHDSGTGYVDAVGMDGVVRRLQYYEYSILEENKNVGKFKDEITKKWECENITYKVMQRLETKKIQKQEKPGANSNVWANHIRKRFTKVV